MKKQSIETIDKEKILDYVEHISPFMHSYIEDHYDSNYYMFTKYISHSDLPNRGKRNGTNESVEKNFLYYLSDAEMHNMEKENKVFESAKQSNIGVPSNFYTAMGMPQLVRRVGAQTTKHNHICLNDYANVYLVNDTLELFTQEYTHKIFDKLGKDPNWKPDEYSVNLSDRQLTNVRVTHAIHGIGTSDDENFSKLRKNIFKNDLLVVIVESRLSSAEKNVFIMLQKNPVFFTLLDMSNVSWQKYLEKKQREYEYMLSMRSVADSDEDEKTRKQQNKWRILLAEEMMNYSTIDGEVFCPITFLSGDFNEVGTLFRASHIKPFAKCKDVKEAYDINNGILMCANADALFDKHLFTISPDKEIIPSFVLKKNQKLMNNLFLTQPIFKTVFNSKRMEYLKEHNYEFFKMEEERKGESGN